MRATIFISLQRKDEKIFDMEGEAEDRSKQFIEALSTLRHDLLNDFTIISGGLSVYTMTKNEKLLENAIKAVDRAIARLKKTKDTELFLSLGGKML
jgi:sensor histidine kinase regulating citrate/malate metabolism